MVIGVLNNLAKITSPDDKKIVLKPEKKRFSVVNFTAAIDVASFTCKLAKENENFLKKVDGAKLTDSIKEGLRTFFNGIVDIINSAENNSSQDFFNDFSIKIRELLKNEKFLKMQDKEKKRVIKTTFISDFFIKFLPKKQENDLNKYLTDMVKKLSTTIDDQPKSKPVESLKKDFDRYKHITDMVKRFLPEGDDQLSSSFKKFLSDMKFHRFEQEYTVESFNELKNTFELYEFRNIIKEILSNIKMLGDIKHFRHINNDIDVFVRTGYEHINEIGLSPEVTEIVKKAKDELGIEMIVPDSPKIANFFYDQFDHYKKLGLDLPDRVNLMELNYFIRKMDRAGSYAPYSREIKLNFMNVCHLIHNGKIDKIADTLRHEMIHFVDNMTIGDYNFNNNDNALVQVILSEDEQAFYNNMLKNLTEYYGKKFLDKNKLTAILDNCNFAKKIKSKKIYDYSDNDLQTKIDGVIEKVSALKTNLQSYLKSERHVAIAMNDSAEFKAYVMEKSSTEEIPEELFRVLKKLGMPDMKDRSYLF